MVESYVLGLLTAQERFEFEQFCETYPELKAARDAFEQAVEKQVRENASAPPSGTKERIWSAIQQPSVSKTSKIISMETTTPQRSSVGFRWLAAASVILFIVAGYFAYNFYNKNKELSDSVKTLQSKVDEMEEYKKVIADPNVAIINLIPTTPAKVSTNIYWDSTKADVYLVVKNLPQLPNDKQYQLWSIINGQDGSLQPKSLGLFDVGGNQKVILKMSNANKADAFAITIENKGNTGGPNLEQLQSMGKTKVQ